MQFSLRMIEEALENYDIDECFEEDEKRNIDNIRLYYPGTCLLEQTLYLETSDTFFHDKDPAVICLHGKNMLRIRSASANDVFNRVLQYFEQKQKWEENINNLITSNCLLKDVLNQFQDVIPFPLMVLDNGQMVLATSDNYGEGALDNEWDIALKTGRFQRETIEKYNLLYQSKIHIHGFYEIPADPFPFPSFNRNIFIENEFVGFISMILVRGNKEVYKDWFDIACNVILKWITLYMQQNEILIRQKAFAELLSDDQANMQKFVDSMKTIGWKGTHAKHLLLLRCVSNVLNMNTHIVKLLNHSSTALYAIEFRNDIAVLVNETMMPRETFIQEVVPMLKKSGYYGGESDRFFDPDQIHQYYLQARVAMAYGEIKSGEFHHIRDHMVPYIFRMLREKNDMDMRHPCLEVMKQYDSQHKTDYYNILKVYLQCGCSQTMAAERLFMHRNSLIRKIEKIRELFHVDLNSYEVRLHLMMSYEMERQER